MKVTVLQSFSGPGLNGRIGEEMDLDGDVLKDMLNAGYVEPARRVKPRAAVLPESENMAMPDAKPAKKTRKKKAEAK